MWFTKRGDRLAGIWAICVAALLGACSGYENQQVRGNANSQEIQLQPVTVDPSNVLTGQTVYVPVYSHIYHHNSPRNVVNLSATLSIRNTDSDRPIIITSVRYFGSDGQLIRQDVAQSSKLEPLSSVSFFVAADDTSGGAGAGFLVDWVAETAVSEPVIEAVMISTLSSQGISFVSPGRVVSQRVRASVTE